jgi:hypothetical protein
MTYYPPPPKKPINPYPGAIATNKTSLRTKTKDPKIRLMGIFDWHFISFSHAKHTGFSIFSLRVKLTSRALLRSICKYAYVP